MGSDRALRLRLRFAPANVRNFYDDAFLTNLRQSDADLGAHDLKEPGDGVKWRSEVPMQYGPGPKTAASVSA